jgi:hypothetical protein
MKMTKKVLGPALLSLALLGFAASCDNSYGMFKAIQADKPASVSLFKKTAPVELVPFDSSYFAHLNAVYSRSLASGVATGWGVVELGDYGSSYTTYGLAATSAGLYAAVRGGTILPTEQKLFLKAPTAGGGLWSDVTAATAPPSGIEALFSVNDKLFAATYDATAKTYALYYLSGATFSATNLSGLATLPVGGVWSNGAYWFAAKAASTDSGSTLYKASTPAAFAADVSGPTALVTALAPLDSIASLAIGTSTGNIYVLNASNSLSAATAATYSTDYGVRTMIEVPVGSSYYLYAGSAALAVSANAGYRESKIDTGAGSLGAFAAVDTSTLQTLPVLAFSYDAANKRLFACASALASTYSGLWSNAYDGSSWGGWVSE